MISVRLLLCCMFVFLLPNALIAQQKADTAGHSLLWRISGNSLSKPSWLFGTIHLICADDYLWTAKMKDALTKCETVCFEVDLGDTSLKRKLARFMMDPGGKKLADYFTPDDYAIVKKYFKDSIKIDITKLPFAKPVLLQSVMLRKLAGCSNPSSYEMQIQKIAVKEHKAIMGIESHEEQMDLLDAMPTDKIVKAIVAFAHGNVAGYEHYRKLVEAYKRQDLPFLYKIAENAKGVYSSDILLADRNKKWIKRMPGKMEAASVFFAVGAAHLWGEEGVITLLRKAGYTVEPLTDTVNIEDHQDEVPAISSPVVFAGSDRKPSPGFDLSQYLQRNLFYPDDARKNNITGRVVIKFIVNEDGRISDEAVVEGIGHGCDEEAIRVFKNMPDWEPGIKDGKPVKVYFTLPITFKL